MQIHLDQVDLFKRLQARRTEDVEDGDDVFVVKVTKKLDLSESTQGEHRVIKWSDALDGNLALRWDVHRGAAEEKVNTAKHDTSKTYHTIPYAPSPMLAAQHLESSPDLAQGTDR